MIKRKKKKKKGIGDPFLLGLLKVVLSLLEQPRFSPNSSQQDIFAITVFLLALASGMRESQWAALTRSHIPLSVLFKRYLNSFTCNSDRLWIKPHNNKAYNPWDLMKAICQVIKEAVPGSNQVRSCASSIAFLRSFDLTKVSSQGQWAHL